MPGEIARHCQVAPPDVAVLTNVAPVHLEFMGTVEAIAEGKAQLVEGMKAGGTAILNADDEIVSSWASGLRAHVVRFSVERELEEGLFLTGRELVSRTKDGQRVLATRDEMHLRGTHNVENVLAAMAAGLACGAPPQSLRETVQRFRPVEHRLEEVAEINGVRFFNDSKATSVDATMKALEAFADEQGKVVLILGGRGKQAPYAPLIPLVSKVVRKMISIGEDAPTIEHELTGAAPFEHATNMHDAVEQAFTAAKPGDVVLLAPACASFDMFESFEHRGRVFKELVRGLKSD